MGKGWNILRLEHEQIIELFLPFLPFLLLLKPIVEGMMLYIPPSKLMERTEQSEQTHTTVFRTPYTATTTRAVL